MVRAGAYCNSCVKAQHIGVNIGGGVGVVKHRPIDREQADRAPSSLIRQRCRASVAADPCVQQAQGNVTVGLHPDIAAVGLQHAACSHAYQATGL